MIFVDTGGWFAWFVTSDPAHQAVNEFLRSNSLPLVTTDYCVDELLTLLVYRGETNIAKVACRALLESQIARLHFVSSEQFQRAGKLFSERIDSKWSFTDCASKIVMDDLGIETAVALDRHFRAFGTVNVVP